RPRTVVLISRRLPQAPPTRTLAPATLLRVLLRPTPQLVVTLAAPCSRSLPTRPVQLRIQRRSRLAKTARSPLTRCKLLSAAGTSRSKLVPPSGRLLFPRQLTVSPATPRLRPRRPATATTLIPPMRPQVSPPLPA